VCVLVVCSDAYADDDDAPDPDALQIHGFASQGYLKSTHNNYLAESRDGSFEFFEAGLTFTKQLTDRLRFGAQFFGHRLGDGGDYKVAVDWAYLDYHLRDWIGIRAGRIKLPFGLYNDTADIDAAHPTALLPQSVYPEEDRNFLLAQTGVELYGYRELPSLGDIEYRFYAGTIYLDVGPQPAGGPIGLVSLRIPYVSGGRIMWETPIPGLRAGVSLQYLRLDTRLLDQRIPAMPVPVDASISARLAVASVEYEADDALFAFEYARWKSTIDSSNPMIIPEDGADSSRAYGMMAYRVRPWLQPALTYSVLYAGKGQLVGAGASQHDASATLRFDLNPFWLLKLELHAMRGTAALNTTLNPGVTSVDDLADRWLLFVAKTTVYF
jgi:hypothetical protein